MFYRPKYAEATASEEREVPVEPWVLALIAIMAVAISILLGVALYERRKRETLRKELKQQDLQLIREYQRQKPAPTVPGRSRPLQKPSPLAAPRIVRYGSSGVPLQDINSFPAGLWSDSPRATGTDYPSSGDSSFGGDSGGSSCSD